MPSHRATARFCAAVVILGGLFVAGCTSYTRITDPDTGKMYYTMGSPPARSGMTGALTFRDAFSGSDVNLDKSEVTRLTKEEFERAAGNRETYPNSWYWGR